MKGVLLPPSGKRGLIISTNTEGEKITIRPTVPSDILEAMKTKIYTVGIFPYLLLNDYKNIEKVGERERERGRERVRENTGCFFVCCAAATVVCCSSITT